MTTIERAKKFFNRIDWWSGSNSYKPGWTSTDFTEWTAPRLWCQARVARALIRQEMLRVDQDCEEVCECIGPCMKAKGLDEALSILDAVYGREKKS